VAGLRAAELDRDARQCRRIRIARLIGHARFVTQLLETEVAPPRSGAAGAVEQAVDRAGGGGGEVGVGEGGGEPRQDGIQRGRIGRADGGGVAGPVPPERMSAGVVLEYGPENRYFGGNGDLPWPRSHSAPANSRTGSARRSTARSASRS